jgi:hypothetical protein
MRAFHTEPNAIKADEIAARQLHALKQHYTGQAAAIGREGAVRADEGPRIVPASGNFVCAACP